MAYYRIVHETIELNIYHTLMIPHDYVTGLYQQDCTLYIYQYDHTHYIDRTVHITAIGMYILYQ